MSKLIRDWEELSKVQPNKKYKLDIDLKYGCGWIRPVNDKILTDDNYFEHNIYLSTHSFYGIRYEKVTKTLQKYGFDIELDNWDKDKSYYNIQTNTEKKKKNNYGKGKKRKK